MHEPDFCDAFEIRDGRLFWRNPPPEHAEKLGLEAGYINRGRRHANKDYWQVRLGGRTYKRSRVIFYMTHGRWPEPVVDHINGNSLDDRPENLREATVLENCRNKRAYKKRSGLPRGVTPYRYGYRAQITVEGRREVLGFFLNKWIAALAYEARRLEVFGDFA
jgi:hypothetical protein